MREFLTAADRRAQEALAGLWALGRPPEAGEVTFDPPAGPGPDYLDAVIDELDRRGVGMVVEPDGSARLSGPGVRALSPELVRTVRTCRAALIDRFAARYALALPGGFHRPRAGSVVEWVGDNYPEDPGDCGVCPADRLPGTWVRWRYVTIVSGEVYDRGWRKYRVRVVPETRWHAWSGHTWEE